MTDAGRAERIARNEARWREINAELERGLTAIDRDPDERAAFVCECGRAQCGEMVKLPLEAYQQVHADDRRFVVLPGHEFPDVEQVVDEGPDYLVIAKRDIGDVEDIVARD